MAGTIARADQQAVSWVIRQEYATDMFGLLGVVEKRGLGTSPSARITVETSGNLRLTSNHHLGASSVRVSQVTNQGCRMTNETTSTSQADNPGHRHVSDRLEGGTRFT